MLKTEYAGLDIGNELDTLSCDLVVRNLFHEILFLSSAMVECNKQTEFSRICSLGAAIQLGDHQLAADVLKINPNFPNLASTYAKDYRKVKWKSRAAFMEKIVDWDRLQRHPLN